MNKLERGADAPVGTVRPFGLGLDYHQCHCADNHQDGRFHECTKFGLHSDDQRHRGKKQRPDGQDPSGAALHVLTFRLLAQRETGDWDAEHNQAVV